MAAETILYLDDQLHYSKSFSSIYGVSSTEAGWNKDFVRDPNWTGGWKPANGVADEQIIVDGGSAGWLGTTAGDSISCAIAYDARGCDQLTIGVYHDAADNPAGVFAQLKDTFTINTDGPTVDVVDFAIPAAGKRYVKLSQANADRGGGTKTVPIYGISFYGLAHKYNVDTGYLQDAIGPGDIDMVSQVGVMQTPAGLLYTNKNGRTFQEFDLPFSRGSAALYAVIRDEMVNLDGPNRTFYLNFDGLTNYALSNFQMVRLASSRWTTTREYRDYYDMRIRLRTEPGPL